MSNTLEGKTRIILLCHKTYSKLSKKMLMKRTITRIVHAVRVSAAMILTWSKRDWLLI
jgi:hypothetical protein